MVAFTRARCTDEAEWIAFSYALGRDRGADISLVCTTLAKLGAFGLDPLSGAPIAELAARIRLGADDGRTFPPATWRLAVELLANVNEIIKLRGGAARVRSAIADPSQR